MTIEFWHYYNDAQKQHLDQLIKEYNGTKSNPCLQGDIIGDWREEVLVRSEDNASLRL